MQLVEEGRLSLTDRLDKFLDESWLAKDIAEKIEIRHLLTHSSGLGSYFNQTYMESSKNSYRALDDYKPLISGETLQFEPGTGNRYSNTGMFLLGVVIEKVTGQDYFSYIRDRIYGPAGMGNSDSYEMDQPVPNLAIGYEPSNENETGWSNNLYLHVLKGGPAGGGFSTVSDLHKFALALTGFKLLGREYTEELYSPKPGLHSPDYGYGFGIRGSSEDRVVGHSGGFAGISSNLDIYLDRGFVSVVLSNYGGGSQPLVNKIRELLARVDGSRTLGYGQLQNAVQVDIDRVHRRHVQVLRSHQQWQLGTPQNHRIDRVSGADGRNSRPALIPEFTVRQFAEYDSVDHVLFRFRGNDDLEAQALARTLIEVPVAHGIDEAEHRDRADRGNLPEHRVRRVGGHRDEIDTGASEAIDAGLDVADVRLPVRPVFKVGEALEVQAEHHDLRKAIVTEALKVLAVQQRVVLGGRLVTDAAQKADSAFARFVVHQALSKHA
jgi:CubicO group peptidase (beta-lactamase class C family)